MVRSVSVPATRKMKGNRSTDRKDSKKMKNKKNLKKKKKIEMTVSDSDVPSVGRGQKLPGTPKTVPVNINQLYRLVPWASK